jgi:hypothetical protein
VVFIAPVDDDFIVVHDSNLQFVFHDDISYLFEAVDLQPPARSAGLASAFACRLMATELL